MKKLLLLVISLLLFTGCKVDYNLTINNDGTVKEDIYMTGTKEFFDVYYKSSKINIINMMLDIDKDSLINNSYKYEVVDNATPYVYASKSFYNISDYSNKTIFFKQYFDGIVAQNNNGIITFKTSGFKPIDPDDPSRYDIKDTYINIKVPYKVIEHNALKVKNNVYTWSIKNSTSDFNIKLVYDSSEKNKNNDSIKQLLIVLLALLIIWGGYFMFRKKKD